MATFSEGAQMRFLRQSIVGLFLVSVTAGLLFLAVQTIYGAVSERMAQEPRVPQQRERVFTVNVVTAAAESITPEIRVFGEIQSLRTLELRAASGGTIRELSPAFQEGGQVRAGDVLIQIDTSDAEDSLARAKSELLDAEIEVRDADRGLEIAKNDLSSAIAQAELRAAVLERQRDLKNRGVATASEIETAELNLSSSQQQELSSRQSLAQAEARIDQAAASLDRARIAVTEAERNLNDLKVVAEFDGTLAEVSAVQGGLVSANERLGELIDPNALEVAFRVSTSQYAQLLDETRRLRAAKVEVSLNVSGFDLTATGTISRESAAVGEGLTGRLIFATLDNARGLKPGDFVSVAVQEAPLENVVVLPASALDAQDRVLVLGEEDRLEMVDVRLLRRQGDDVIVRSRAIVDREVVTRQTPLLGAGIRVKPIREGGAEETAAAATPEMVELTDERRAKLVAFVESNTRMPSEVKQRLLGQLQGEQVPARVIDRLEQRMGG
jgi:RND family efflux transporter MFP subunit